MSEKFETVKYYDCQKMPQDVRTNFFERCGSPSFRGSNDCVVEWMLWGKCGSKCVSGELPYWMKNVYDDEVPYAELNENEILEDRMCDDKRYVIQRGDCIVSDWLFDNGAEMYEEVLIKHWW